MKSEELAEHCTEQDCWVAVNGKVYDVTAFLDGHPGGAEAILKYAGRDASRAYNENHAPDQLKELEPEFVVGEYECPLENKKDQSKSIEKPIKPLWSFISASCFEKLAKEELSGRALSYFDSGGEDQTTYMHNQEDWKKVIFRPRVLVDVSSATLTSLPIFIAPFAMPILAHPDKELALLKGAAQAKIPYCVSSNTQTPLETLSKSKIDNQRLYFQLYMNKDRKKSEETLKSLKPLGFVAVVITVDNPVPSKRDRDILYQVSQDLTDYYNGIKVNGTGTGVGAAIGSYCDDSLNWNDIEYVRRLSKLPIYLKGIQRVEDALLAVKHKADGIYISNHGGRQLDTTASTVEICLEIKRNAPEVFEKLDVWIDGGIRRGSDIIKALCLGCKSVGLGRAFVYALHPHGSDGIVRLTGILENEMRICMKLLGVTSLAQLDMSLLNTRRIDQLLSDPKVISNYLSRI